MKRLPLIILLLGVVCIGLSPLSCRWVRNTLIPSTEPAQKLFSSSLEADVYMIKETKRFFAVLGMGMFLLCLGDYLRGRYKTNGYMDRVMFGSNCSKCGKFWVRRECNRGKQFGLIPRLTCPDCGGFVEKSSAVFLALGLIFFFGPLLAFIYFDPTPKIFDATAGYSLFFGFVLFTIGLLKHNRQLEKAQQYFSSTNQSKKS